MLKKPRVVAVGSALLMATALLSQGAPAATQTPPVSKAATIVRDANATGISPEAEVSPTPQEAAAPTAYSRTTSEPDGTFSTAIYETPINHYDEIDGWLPIDNRLSDPPGQRYVGQNNSNSYTLKLPANPSADSLQFINGTDSIAFRLLGTGSDLRISGATAVIPLSAASDADRLLVETQATGVKESIVVEFPPPTADSLVFDYVMSGSDGVKAVLTPENWVSFRNRAGEIVAEIPPPVMWDSAKVPAVTSEGMNYALEQQGPHDWRLRLRVDASWLLDPARVYPVVVDPSLLNQPVQADCWVYEGAPTSSYCGTTTNYIRAGRTGPSQRYRGLLRFDVSPIPPSAIINSATVQLYMNPAESTNSQSTELAMHGAGKAWNNSATWDTNGLSDVWTGGSPGATSYGPNSLSGRAGVAGYKAFGGLANPVKAWLLDPVLNRGLVLKATTDTGTNAIAFHSSSPAASNNGRRPFLNVNYSNDPDDSFEPGPEPTSTAYAGVNSDDLDDITELALEDSITVTEAVQRYGWHDEFARDVEAVEAANPATFSYARLSTTSKAATVYFKGSTAPQIPSGTLDDPSVPVTVQTGMSYSNRDVEKLVADTSAAIVEVSGGATDFAVHFDNATQSLRATVRQPATAQTTAESYRLAARGEMQEQSPTLVLPDVDVTVVDFSPAITTDLHGGVRIAHQNVGPGDPECTSGFAAKWFAPGLPTGQFYSGLLTAGHCDNRISTYSYEQQGQRDAIDDAAIVIPRTDGDIQFHPKSGNEKATPYFYNRIGRLRPAKGYRTPFVEGRKMCIFGRKTLKKRCGRVLSWNASYSVDGVMYSNMIRLATPRRKVMNTEGDSGGPAYSGNFAMGLISGLNCSRICIPNSDGFVEDCDGCEFVTYVTPVAALYRDQTLDMLYAD